VLLPHPDGPINETNPPFGTDRLTSCSTRFTRPATLKSTQTPRAQICAGDCEAVLDRSLIELDSSPTGQPVAVAF
jgi:hypothetical protein